MTAKRNVDVKTKMLMIVRCCAPVSVACFVFFLSASAAALQPSNDEHSPKSEQGQQDTAKNTQPAPSTTSLAASSSHAHPLPTIPLPQPTALGVADPDSKDEIEKAISDLVSVAPKQREMAAAVLADLDEAMLPAIAEKLIALRKSADREAMTKLLEQARKDARADLKKNESEETDDAPASDKSKDSAEKSHSLFDPNSSDWLKYVLMDPEPKNQAYRDLVSVLALTRACTGIGTTEAARQIINVYMYFGDMFRIDVQRQLARLNERAVPALIEAQYNDSRMVRTWAKRRLDILGRAIPSEAVHLADNQALADVLRAYGKAREVEAVRVIVSFANSDRLQVRQAAREAIGQIGEPAHWQLRDAYEQLMGEKPSRSWDWRRTARELFGVYDRARLQEVYTAMEEGIALAGKNELEKAIAKFDQVLARAPLFERRNEMIPVYLAYAKQLTDNNADKASAVYRRAIAMDSGGEHVNKAKSALAVMEAEQLAQRGVLDTALLDRAVQLDPSNQQARQMRDKAKMEAQVTQTAWRRYAAATAVGVVALVSMIIVASAPRRKRRACTEDEPTKPVGKEPSAAPARRNVDS